MAGFDISALPTRVQHLLEAYMREVEKEFNLAVDRAKVTTEKEFSDYRIGRIEKLYKEAIDRFYADYTPVESGYHRQGHLYNLLEIGRDSAGVFSYIDFDPGEMTPYRSGYRDMSGEGDGLYDKVFKHGWHGGADKQSIEKDAAGKDPHPDPGTPYWRAGPYFSVWGGPAAIADTPPYYDFKKTFEEADAPGGEHHEVLNKIFQKNVDEEAKKMNLRGGVLNAVR